jgi:hypothetical protein
MVFDMAWYTELQEATTMEVVRKVVDSELIGSVIALPGSFRNKKVEVLVLPLRENVDTSKPKKSYLGAFAKYANPSLIARVNDAGADASAEEDAQR